MKTRVAVLFGGRSPEHDVSIVTGLQALQALDQERFSPFPVYVAVDGRWYTGEALRNRRFYLPDASALRSVDHVTLKMEPESTGTGRLVSVKRGLFGSGKTFEFDAALLAFHGLFGEDGRTQSLFELANVPYSGMRSLSSAVLMDKAITKRVLGNSGIGLLPDVVLERPAQGLQPRTEDLRRQLAPLPFPLIIKPSHLGSSIGVARTTNLEEAAGTLSTIFRLDTHAIAEPLVEHLVEYNVAVRRDRNGKVITSAIERPKGEGELLNFKDKYMAGGEGSKGGAKGKQPGLISQGMLSLTREINPSMPSELSVRVRDWASRAFDLLWGTGAPRVDFLSNSETGEIWLNEVNPCPGSFAYFLWEAAEKPLLFSELLSEQLDEAFAAHRQIQLPPDPTHPEARLFPRR